MKNKNKIIGSAILSVLVFIVLIGAYLYSRPKAFEEKDLKEVFAESSIPNSKEEKEMRNITVYINGEVKMPGVYSLKFGSRIEELIKKAGGFTEEAEKGKLNLAKKLKDEDCIIVDKKKIDNMGNVISNKNVSNTNASPPEAVKVNINTATKEQLRTIPGVGEVTAQKIMDYREQNGDFASIDDLKKIDRIGEKMINKIRDKIDVN